MTRPRTEVISEAAHAKINLALHVTGQRADGYHLLDSLVAFADIADRVTVAPSDALALTITGPMSDGVPDDATNLVWRAADWFCPGQRAAITLDKHLPSAAGIGGGSSDAAATLRALVRLTGRAVSGDVAHLGADVPVCMMPRAQRMQGIGAVLTPLPPLPPAHLVLVNPRVHTPTPAVFKALVLKNNPPLPPIPAFADAGMLIGWLRTTRNDLQPPAIAGAPVIAEVLAAMQDAPLARMSGSGATCYALFPSQDDAVALAVRLRRAAPGWWVQTAALLP
jgi:4-diphosphocytidyl-2-C-methyl-D-erythritol kinase